MDKGRSGRAASPVTSGAGFQVPALKVRTINPPDSQGQHSIKGTPSITLDSPMRGGGHLHFF